MNHSIIDQYKWLEDRHLWFSLNQVKKINEYGSIWQFLRIISPGELYDLSLVATKHPDIDFFNNAFCPSQIKSKLWLIKELNRTFESRFWPKSRIFIGCAWYNLLSYLLIKHADFWIENISGEDIDPETIQISKSLLRDCISIHNGDIFDCKYHLFDLIINTSCEHIDFQKWLKLIPHGKIVALQSNNYSALDEHINCCDSLEEFTDKCNLPKVYSCGVAKFTDKYDRYMVIGMK